MVEFDFAKSSSFKKAEDSPGFLLWRASTLWRRAIEAVLKPLDLTHPQFVALATIGWFAKTKTPITQAAISKHIELDPNTVSQILKSLEKKKLIARERTHDERSKNPTLTKSGAKRLSEALPAVENADAQFFSAVNLEKASAFSALQILSR